MSEHLIIAGISAKDQSTILKNIHNQRLRKDTFITFLTVSEKNPIYKKSVLETMVDGFARTVSKKSPNTIRIIYMPYKNSTVIEEFFFPFADIQSFDETKTYYDYALKYFDNINEFTKKLLSVIRNGLRIRERPPRSHYLLLPNNNFIVGSKKFSDLLFEYYFGSLDENIFKCIKENTELHCYEDSRNLAFPVTKMNEGNLRFNQAKMPSKHFLSGIYRLGMLWDAGFHFDVKHISKKSLTGYKFTCSVQGEIECNGVTHVNVYLNDYVRVPQK